MKLFGHRGASSSCPENTAAAFKNTLSGDSGARPAVTGVECDMQLLRDGTVVVLHDLQTGAMGALPRFLDGLAARNVEVTTEVPPACVLVRRGAAAQDLAPFTAPVG